MTDTIPTPQDPWQRVRQVHRDYADDYRILAIFVFALVGLTVFFEDWFGYSMNAYTELLSVVVTVLWLDRRAARRAEQTRKEELIAQLKSTNNAVAVGALHMLRHKGWGFGEDESLVRINLSRANLEGANLEEANLAGVCFTFANLSRANMTRANLDGANLLRADLSRTSLVTANLAGVDLVNANLTGAWLVDADLSDANLWFANCTDSDFSRANLEGTYLGEADLTRVNLSDTNLEGAILVNANLEGAKLYAVNLASAVLLNVSLMAADIKDTIRYDKMLLPDGVWDSKMKVRTPESYWTPDTDMERYTNPDHPDFWQPDWVKEQQDD